METRSLWHHRVALRGRQNPGRYHRCVHNQKVHFGALYLIVRHLTNSQFWYS